MNPARPMLPALTSLRFFAALHVLLFHMYAMQIMTGSGFYRSLASVGYVGVSFFFVLSGFILVYTYAGRETTPVKFWQARFARIYPAYLFSLVVTFPFFLFICIQLKNMDIPMFAFQQAHVDPHRIPGTKFGEVFAQLRFMQLTNYRIHFLYSLQTHSGGASTSWTITNYSQTTTLCLARFPCRRRAWLLCSSMVMCRASPRICCDLR